VPNALAQETSPYLRQHAENPVDWLPWGAAALTRARERDVPLLVSIGYSSCHWCHVMERESFENPRVAALMNEEFVCVKVDREERPDVDALYMEAVQSMTGHGGWPLNVFLTPEQLPFYGGTYFPPDSRHGMPAWSEVLRAIAELWRERSTEIRAGGERLREQLAGGALLAPSSEPLQAVTLDSALANLRATFDSRNAGFGSAPKFPQAPVLELLLTQPAAAELAQRTLRAMAAGGIHDQVGGGFHRYAVDATWTVPHFEKMLYDNALLARAYLHGFQRTGEPLLRRVCEQTLRWILRDMRAPEGGFYSALDADSPGGEGSFYVWTLSELQDALGQDAAAAIAWFGVTAKGNFDGERGARTGLNVLEARGVEPPAQQRERIRARLLEVREQRPPPALDDKRLTSWNALAIAALAEAGTALGGDADRAATDGETTDGGRMDGAGAQHYLDAAVAGAEFVLRELRDERGRLLRTYSHGRAALDGYLEDHAFLLEALLVLFEATCQERWLAEARALADELIARFADPQRGGFFSTAADHEALIARRKDIEDSPIPSGSSSAALGLLRLAELTGEREYERQAVGALRLVHEIAARHPTAFGHALQALHWHLSPMRPIACALPPTYAAGAPPAAAREGGGDPYKIDR
jgi:uncharacterized protein